MSGALAGAELGGEFGVAGGPLGVAAGAVIGGLIGLGAGALLANAVSHANEQAGQQLKGASADEACIECGEIPCFPKPDDEEKAARLQEELKTQQDFLNSLSPEDLRDRLAEADKRKAETGSYRPEGDAVDRARARDDFQTNRQEKLREQYTRQGYSADAAKHAAMRTASEEMKTMDAAHELDSIVGGRKGDRIAMRDRFANRSTGSAWKSRVAALKNAVRNAIAKGRKHTNVDLKLCED